LYDKGLEDYFIINDFIKKYEENNDTSQNIVYSHMKEPVPGHSVIDYKYKSQSQN
jgi:hypothetical protein